jgi:hypothetical protein
LDLFWVFLSRVGCEWRSALDFVKPATVIAWHCKGFRLFWTWKIRHGRAGRPGVAGEWKARTPLTTTSRTDTKFSQ